jgi:MscS family membrane protein
MSLLRQNQEGVGRLPKQSCTLSFVFAILFFVGSTVPSPAQLPKLSAPEPKAEPAAPQDPLGRQTPRSSLINFMKYEASGDYVTAARFLQLPPGENLAQLTKEFRTLYPNFQGSINLISDDPNGSVEAGLLPDQERVGVLKVGDTTADLILVRVDDPVAGKIWLISRPTLVSIPKLYAQLEREKPTEASRIRLALLRGPMILGMSSTQWLCWVLSIPLAWVLAWLSTFFLSAPRRVWCKLRNVPFTTVWDTPLGMPIRCMIAILLHGLFVYRCNRPFSIASTMFVSWPPSLRVVSGGSQADSPTRASTAR